MTALRTVACAWALMVGVTAVRAGEQASAPGPLVIDGEAAVVTIVVRPDRAASFDAVIQKLASARAGSRQPQRLAAGWQIFRAQEQVQGNVGYVMRIDPVVKGADYDIPRILGEELPGEAADLARAYREAQAGRSFMALSRVNVPGLGGPAGGDGPAPAPATVPVLSFDAVDAAMVTVLVRPERSADFEATLAHLGRALQASPAPGRKRQAAGWRVFKGTQLFGGNIPYVLSLDPIVPRVEYDPIRLIQETYPEDIDAIYAKYKAAFVGQAISRLNRR